MNVRELKEKLNEFPDDTMVVLPSIKGGCWEIELTDLSSVRVALKGNHSFFIGGPHKIIEEQDNKIIRETIVDGFRIKNIDK